MHCIPKDYFDFVKRIAEQTPEKPDYWSSCGQCSNNTDIAEDILERTEKSFYSLTQEDLDKLMHSKYSTPDEPINQVWFNRKDVLRILQEAQEIIRNKMKFQIEESGGRISMLHKVAKEKKPYRQEKPKEKRKPDYTGARQQKRGEVQ